MLSKLPDPVDYAFGGSNSNRTDNTQSGYRPGVLLQDPIERDCGLNLIPIYLNSFRSAAFSLHSGGCNRKL